MQICKFRSKERWEVSVKSLVKETWRCHLQPTLPYLSRCRNSCSKSVSFPVSCVGLSPLKKCVEMTHSWLPYGRKHFLLPLDTPSPIAVPLLTLRFSSFSHAVGNGMKALAHTRQALHCSTVFSSLEFWHSVCHTVSLFCLVVTEGGAGEGVCELAQWFCVILWNMLLDKYSHNFWTVTGM